MCIIVSCCVYVMNGGLAVCECKLEDLQIMTVCVCLIMGDFTVMRYQDVWTPIAPHLCLTSPVIEVCVLVCDVCEFLTGQLRLQVLCSDVMD